MRFALFIFLLAGCSSAPPKELSPEALAKRNAEIKNTCDFMVGPHPELPEYEKCMEVVGAELN
ncbi:MAG: hypothetical protein WA632_07910 [Gallionella sp.]